MVPTCKVFQITANELWQEHQNYMKTHFHDHSENLHTAVLSNFSFAQNTFLMKAIFIQRAFKNIQGLLGKIQGLFKDIPQISSFQGLFMA